MWVSRISSLGAQAIKTLTRGQAAYAPGGLYLDGRACRDVQSSLRLRQMQQYFCTTAATDSCEKGNEDEKWINVTFVETDGTEKSVEVPVGTSILEAALSIDVELEGACEGSCACSTCHVIVTDIDYNRLPDPADEEYDMLDLAFGLTKTKLPKEVDTDTSEQVNMADVSVSEGGNDKEPFPSPMTPAYVRHSSVHKDSSEDVEEVEDDSCRSFEGYLIEMIIEGQVKDLKDVEELLYCWRNLKSPIFVDLVSRFYGEVCNDLFSSSEEDESQITTISE